MNQTLNTYQALVRSELREHRSLLWVPIGAAVLIILLTLAGFFFGNIYLDDERYSWLEWLATVPPGDIEFLDVSVVQQASRGVTAALTALFFLPMLFILYGYLCGSLHDDRRDRSILFWKSLPISDHDTVLAKLLVAVVVVPVVILACVWITQVVILGMASVGLLYVGFNPIVLLWGPAQVLSQTGLLLLSAMIQALWLLPVAAWLLLCSAYAPRVPWLFALAVPGLLSVLMRLMDLFMGTHLKALDPFIEIGRRLFDGPLPTSIHLSFDFDAAEADAMVQGIPLLQLSEVLSFLSTGRLWLGLLVAAGLILLAIDGRRRAVEL